MPGSGTYTSLNTSSAGILRGVTSGDSVALLASAPGAASPRNFSQTLGGNRCLMLGPGANLDLYLPPGSRLIVLALPSSATNTRRALGGADAVQYCELDASQGEFVARCMESLEDVRNDPTSQTAQRDLRELLKPAASLFQEASVPSLAKRSRLQRHIAVIRACEFVDSHLRA